MIHLFTIACPEPSSDTWWATLLRTERSYCFDQLTSLLEPAPTHAARFEWLDSLCEAGEPELAERFGVLRGFPGYFERLWEQSRVDGAFHIGNADQSAQRLLPGLWLLWPDMKFLFCYRDGIGVIDATLGPTVEPGKVFERACTEWAERVSRLRAHQAWLSERRANVRETRLEWIVEPGNELRHVWTMARSAMRQRDACQRSSRSRRRSPELELEPDDRIWERWHPDLRSTFAERCGELQLQLGYGLPHPERRRRSLAPRGGRSSFLPREFGQR